MNTRMRAARGKAVGGRHARGRRRALGLVALPVAALLGIILGMGLFDRVIMPAVVRHHDEVRIPSVAGQDLTEARRIVRDAGLDPQIGEGRYHRGVPRGKVLEVTPPVGMSVKKGRQVFLTPSLGEHQTLVPDLLGQSLRMARVEAGDAGMRVGEITYAATDLAIPDQILAMSPPPGTGAPPGGEIDLLMSRPRAPVPFWMPDLVGEPGARASGLLQRSGLLVLLDEQPGAVPGTVFRQDPAPGSPIWPGARVRLTVSPARTNRYGGRG